MLRGLKDLEGAVVRANDGDIGHVRDLYFDDRLWVIRYLVVETGNWLSSRKVLITPMSIGDPSWMQKIIPVTLTRAQVKASPDFDTAKPVSRQYEAEYLGHYGYPDYWNGNGLWGMGAYPDPASSGEGGSRPPTGDATEAGAPPDPPLADTRRIDADPELRSGNEVARYHIHASDGDIGHVAGMLIDDETWAIRYLVVQTSAWWSGHKVLIAPRWITEVNWFNRNVAVDLTRDAVRNSPPYDPAITPDRAHELDVYRHYGRRGYWHDAEMNNETASFP